MISLKDEHPKKAHAPTSGRLGGSVISLNEVHPSKADSQMLVRLGGSVISLNDVHPEKACPPIPVRVGGSAISLKDVHPGLAKRALLATAAAKPKPWLTAGPSRPVFVAGSANAAAESAHKTGNGASCKQVAVPQPATLPPRRRIPPRQVLQASRPPTRKTKRPRAAPWTGGWTHTTPNGASSTSLAPTHH